jgi:hypothetical protein
MNQRVTREILWNVPVAFRIFLYAMLIPQRRLWLLVRATPSGRAT